MDLWTATKAGDFERVRYLVEDLDADINAKNEFNAIPLFYACLCGHTELVKYFLGKGAILESGTFEGERCYYAALTPEITDILKNFKAKPKPINMLVEHLRTLQSTPQFHDVEFIIENKSIPVHRFLLACRSPYLCNKLRTQWLERNKIVLKHLLIRYEAFDALMQFIYTGSVNIDTDHVDAFLALLKQCQFMDLRKRVDFENNNREDQSDRLIINASEQEIENTLVSDLRVLWKTIVVGERDEYADVVINVEDASFQCHRALLIARSEYFRGLFSGHFKETTDSTTNVVIKDMNTQVFVKVLEFVYTNNVEDMEDYELGLNIMTAADRFLMTGLKHLCVLFLCRQVNMDNVYDILYAAEIFGSYRLSETCLALLAENIHELWESEDFIEYLRGCPLELQKRVKNSIEEYLVHYGQTPRWEQIEQQFDALVLKQ